MNGIYRIVSLTAVGAGTDEALIPKELEIYDQRARLVACGVF